MKLWAFVLLLSLVALASAIPRKKKETEKPLLPRIFLDLTKGEVPYFSEEEMASDHYKTAMGVAWKADGKINARFGNMLADRVSSASFAPFLFKFVGECATIPGALEWELSMPEQEGYAARTIVLSREQGWLELNLATGESVPRTTMPQRSLRSLSVQPLDAVVDVAGPVDAVVDVAEPVDAAAAAIAAQ